MSTTLETTPRTASEAHPASPVLIVDDEVQTLQSCKIVLKAHGITNVITESDSRNVLPLLHTGQPVSVMLMDLTMPHINGRELLSKIRPEFTGLPIIVVTGQNDLETAVACMRDGAFDYIVKPVDKNRLVSSVQRALQFGELERENTLLKRHILSAEVEHPEVFATIVSNNRQMRQIFKYVESIASTSQPVLVVGETGVGKELMAQAIHNLSGRRGSFVPINVAGLDDTVFSDTLFGHRKGAFTGATGIRKGLVESAAGGTLFLDEIGDLQMTSQVKLLRLLQEREYYPLGADIARRSDARVVVATNQDLKELIKKGLFRKDLYFRLQTHTVALPPLRERKDDIPLLVGHFVEEACRSIGKKRPAIPKELYTLLKTYHFPGNVRELESMIFDAISKHESRMLSLDVFRDRIFKETGHSREAIEELPEDDPAVRFGERLPTLKEAAWLLLDEAMRRAENNQSIAARMLGITQQAMSKRLKNRDRELAGQGEGEDDE